jgi:Ca2+-binding RTX toxin-like protein
MYESLEDRKLFAATAVLAGSTLVITGTAANDAIHVNVAGPVMQVNLNGVPVAFGAAAVKAINVRLLAGHDLFTANATIWQPILGLGGDGNDTMVGGRAGDRFYGENGMDKLVGNDGNDYLFGGNDSDSLYGGNHHDTLVAGLGRDYCDGGLHRDYIYTAGDGAQDKIRWDPIDFVSKDPWDIFV